MDVELARQHWLDGTRRIEGARGDPRRHTRLLGGVEAVLDGLRQRVGQTFTLAELARAYDGADDWVRELLDEQEPEGAVPSEPGTIADAAFHAYARGAVDYRP
ncbi:MAG TPA: hypothetical protein VFA97_12015 [Gaiellaceae bacterium]|nr:hypothetical protein [Gaiellaceae bacterium]